MRKLYYMCVQPATLYYAWQVEVMVNNFLKNGISSELIQILAVISSGEVPLMWKQLEAKYPNVRFFFYNDLRLDKIYQPSIKPHIMAQHFERFPELKHEAIFYHDCDMVFTGPVDWSKFVYDDVWYLSNTSSYIGATYIKSKKYGIYERMCEIIDIEQNIPEDNEENTGGAQYILKNVDAVYWHKVEKDSNTLYAFFQEHLKEHPHSPTYHPIQAWTAEMWATLWNGWFFTHEIKVVKEMEFCWPTNDIQSWDTCNIYHNAGVVDTKSGMFHKGSYINVVPYSIAQEDFSSQKCSYRYVREILNTAEKTVLL
jgi:hypothetical protein